MKILIVATSHEQLGDTGRKTGLWLEELAFPYYVFKDAGAVMVLASPRGGVVPLDPKSESILASTPTIRRFQKDPEGISLLAHSIALPDVKVEDFDMVYVAGGHGALWDFPENEVLKELLQAFIRHQKVVGLVSHGVAALLALQNFGGEPFVKGRHLTAFSDSEQQVAGLTAVVPFSLESKLVAEGALYTKGDDFRTHTVTDGRLICGQNPISSLDVSRRMLALLKESTKEMVPSRN
ncbi:MAG TPA: type 1 glutamine amidotransferase domain-containing protein [Puia sp.]|jgi:putative intracellular protease/amidase|nr:type 1 glutamine amidotransferase domain-containing protein [Puia sp.]